MMNIRRTTFLLLAGALLLHSQARAAITDPEIDFINTPEDVCAEYGISKKDEIIRLELDVNGDARPTVFLTYKGTGSRGGAVWTAYSPMATGYTRLDGVQFREDLVRAGKVDELNPNGGLLVLYPGKGAGNLVRYKFEGGKAIQEDVQTIDYSNPEHQQLFERLFGRKLSEPMPDEFFKKPSHQVIEVKSIEAREASKPNSDTAETATNETSQKVNSPQFAQPPALKIAPDAQSASPPSEETTSSMPWSIIVVLVLAATGLLWLLVKKRK